MKTKIFLIAAAIILSAANLYSQKISVSLEGGVNFANVKFNPEQVIPRETRTGMIAGALADFCLIQNKLSAETGIEYVMKGYKVTSGQITGTIKLDYLEFPALLKLKFPMKQVIPYAVAGPTFGVLLTSKGVIDSGTSQSESDFKNETKSTDFGLFFGAGMDIRTSKKVNIFFQGGYSLGLSNFNNVPSSTLETKNYGVRVTGGIRYIFK